MSDLTDQAFDAVAVTPGATAIPCTRALYVGAAGSITVTMKSGASVTFAGVNAGTVLPIRVVAVTTAAGGSILALY